MFVPIFLLSQTLLYHKKNSNFSRKYRISSIYEKSLTISEFEHLVNLREQVESFTSNHAALLQPATSTSTATSSSAPIIPPLWNPGYQGYYHPYYNPAVSGVQVPPLPPNVTAPPPPPPGPPAGQPTGSQGATPQLSSQYEAWKQYFHNNPGFFL